VAATTVDQFGLHAGYVCGMHLGCRSAGIAHLSQQPTHSDPQKLLTREAGGLPGSTEKEQEG
jgi:hypothetical protein